MARLTTRRLLAVPVLALSLLAVPTAVADDPSTTPTGAVVQSYSGKFVAPTRFTDGEGGFPGLGRKVYLVAQAADGVIADVFAVTPDAAGGAFVLGDVVDATGEGQLDIYFYSDLASAADGTAVTTGEYASPDKGEQGFVPAGTTHAIVFSPNAVNSTFSFTATRRPQVRLTALDGVTMPKGSTLGIQNDTADYASIAHRAPRNPLVNRSGQGNGLRVGEVVDVRFASAGTYVFDTSDGVKTVTVSS